MEKDQPVEEKKIWIDPELTLMPMEKIKSHNAVAPHEVAGDDDVASGS
jgi:hypothetical protein